MLYSFRTELTPHHFTILFKKKERNFGFRNNDHETVLKYFQAAEVWFWPKWGSEEESNLLLYITST